MTEAKKLTTPDASPSVDSARLIEVEGADDHLGPTIEALNDVPTRLNVPNPKLRQRKTLLRRLALHMLVFLLLGLVMFGVGAAMALALFNGVFDQYTPIVKAWVHEARDVWQQLLKH